MTISENIFKIKNELPSTVKLVAVSKYKPAEAIMEAYEAGQRAFGENRPQELKLKAESLPSDIEWHFIGHLQTNKLKMVIPYTYLIHSIDTYKLLSQIDDYCFRNTLQTQVLLEVHIAREETKQGFSESELLEMLDYMAEKPLRCVTIRGLMAMASLTDDSDLIRSEFANLVSIKNNIMNRSYTYLDNFNLLSFGMSNDYHIAIEMGTSIVRIGTSIFGER